MNPIEQQILHDLENNNIEDYLKRHRNSIAVSKDTILKVYYEHVCPKAEPKNTGKPHAYVVDMDGTLCGKCDRGYFDYHKVLGDPPNTHIVNIVKSILAYKTAEVIIVTGRDDVCFGQTKEWLRRHLDILHPYLLMRKRGDHRKDREVKQEIYREHIEPKFDVQAAFDDRPSSIRCWRELGIPVLMCGNEYDF